MLLKTTVCPAFNLMWISHYLVHEYSFVSHVRCLFISNRLFNNGRRQELPWSHTTYVLFCFCWETPINRSYILCITEYQSSFITLERLANKTTSGPSLTAFHSHDVIFISSWSGRHCWDVLLYLTLTHFSLLHWVNVIAFILHITKALWPLITESLIREFMVLIVPVTQFRQWQMVSG